MRIITPIFSLLCLGVTMTQAAPIDVASYPTLQAAIDANPGRILQIPAGDYTISTALTITHDGTELYGPARITQTNPDEPMVRIERASGVRLANLSFTRGEGRQEATQAGIDVSHCRDLELSHLRVTENHSHTSILVQSSSDVTVEDCTIINYKGQAIDDRLKSDIWGYAFKSIDGTGIQMLDVQGCMIRDNRIEELRLWPTKELRDKYNLGALTAIRPGPPGRLMTQDIIDTHYTNNWHQGAGLQVTSPDKSRRVLITGNYIFHPAQGIDLHVDNVTVANNFIAYAMTGMKAMHGAKHVLINANQFTYCDLYGIMLMAGAASHESANAEDGKRAATENVDGGTIISNNIISDFGLGEQYWNWAPYEKSHSPIAILEGQLAENPPVRDVLITGNLVYDSGRDTVMVNGKWTKEAPRYFYALYVEQQKQPAPVNVQVFGNLLNPGLDGASNYTEPPH